MPDFSDDTISKKARRKIRNTSLILPCVIERIAQIKGISVTETEAAIYRNTLNCFNINTTAHETIYAANHILTNLQKELNDVKIVY